MPDVQPSSALPEDLPLDILFNDPDLVVVNKPAGMVVHPAAGNPTGTLVNALLHHVKDLSGIGGEARPGIVHRLDKGTSGVMVIAKNDDAHKELARQFHDREVEKEYVALAWGLVQQRKRINAAIGRDPKNRVKMSTRAGRARSAVTRVTWSRDLKGVTLLRVAIATGRTHQIRVHLSAIGHPDRRRRALRRRPSPRSASASRGDEADAPVPARRAPRLHASAYERAPRVHGAVAGGSRGGGGGARSARSVRCGICPRAAATGRVRDGGLADLASRHAELRQLRRNHPAVRRRIDLFVDVHDPAVEADVERPPRRKRLIFVDDAIGRGHGLGRIAQQRIVDAEGLRKRLVGFRCVDADGKVRDVEAPDFLATLTE